MTIKIKGILMVTMVILGLASCAKVDPKPSENPMKTVHQPPATKATD